MLTTIGKPYRSRIFALCFGGWILPTVDRAKVPATRQGFKNQRTTKEGHILIFIAISSCYLDASLREKVMATMKMPVAPGLRAGQLDLFSFLPSGREHRVTRRYIRCNTAITTTQPQQPHTHTHLINHIYIFMCFPKSNPARIAPLRLIRMEAKTREAEANLAAARKLLKVTCDASLQLTENLEITQPERAFLEILGVEAFEVQKVLAVGLGFFNRDSFVQDFF